MNTTSKEKIIEIAKNLLIDGSENDPIIISEGANFDAEHDVWTVIFEVDSFIDPSAIFVEVHDKTHETRIIPTL